MDNNNDEIKELQEVAELHPTQEVNEPLTEQQDYLIKLGERLNAERQELMNINHNQGILYEKHQESLGESIKDLKKYQYAQEDKLKDFDDKLFVLDKILIEIRTAIKSIDPKEGFEVMQKYNDLVEEFARVVQGLQTQLASAKNQAVASIRAMAAEVSDHTKARYTKISSYIAAMIFFTTCISCGMCYFMMKKFPAYVRITGASEISITGGDVRILESPSCKGCTIKTPIQK